ncbi:MAG: O-antigen ligase family protein [Aureliella sp.]
MEFSSDYKQSKSMLLRSNNDAPHGTLSLSDYFRQSLLASSLASLSIVLLTLRLSVAGIAYPAIQTVVSPLSYAILATSAVYIAVNIRGLWGASTLIILGTLPSVVASSHTAYSLNAWLAWSAVLVAFGPVARCRASIIFKQVAWKSLQYACWAVSLMSLGWYLFGLPNLGRGHFTGVMSHSMLLGPIAALAALFAFHNYVTQRHWAWNVLCLGCIIPCMIAGSRAAFAGLAISVAALAWSGLMKTKLSSGLAISIVLGASLAFALELDSVASSVKGVPMLQTLASKQIADKDRGFHTRSYLWQSRLAEFQANPVFGLGFCLDTSMAKRKQLTNTNLEPGSGYLFIASSTGTVGIASFFLFGWALLSKTRSRFTDNRRFAGDVSYSVVVFFLVHSIAEGWILSAGNILCVFFWLAIGRAFDASVSDRLTTSVAFRNG